MKNEVIIREYEQKDEQAIIELLRLNTPRYFAPEEEEDLVQYLHHEIDRYFVLELEGVIAGCGGINFDEAGTAGKISWDIFHPRHQGKGLGSLLLQHRVNKLKALPHIQTISVRTSQLVYPFYEKNGFAIVEVVTDYWAPGYDLYRMIYKGR
jgi:[ribosomal protein S18]-alanine N-acetyltransferase